MHKVYKVKFYRIILNIIYGLVAAGFAFIIAGIWLDIFVAVAIGLGIFVLYVWVVILGNMITVTVTDKYLIVKNSKGTKQYDINTSSFYARRSVSRGDSTCEIRVEDLNGHSETIDLDLLGSSQFYELVGDLGITGDKAPVQRVETKRK